MAKGCCIISQHADSTAHRPRFRQHLMPARPSYCVGFNIDMLSVAPDAA
jgi:basic membrane protein A